MFHFLVGLHVSTYLLGAAAVFVATMDPTVKVAFIAATPSAFTGVGYLVLRYFDVKESKRQFNVLHEISTNIEKHTNGINSALRDRLNTKSDDLLASDKALEHAKGRREGREDAEDRADVREQAQHLRQAQDRRDAAESENITMGTPSKNTPPSAKAIGDA